MSPASAIEACLTVQVLFGLPLRQTTGFVASLLRLAGLDWPVPFVGRSFHWKARSSSSVSTLCRRQRTLSVQLPYRGSGRPLHLLVDSTGIKARKHGGARRRVWRKVHLAVDETTLEVRAVEITGSGGGDAPMLLGLLPQIPEGEPIASVTADGAYDGRACRDAIADRDADAIIPPRRNAKPWEKDSPGAGARKEALRAIGRVGRTIWRRWSGYHRRSRVETRMTCMKLLGQKLMPRDFGRQTAELQVRICKCRA